jgi:hypothetical protein
MWEVKSINQEKLFFSGLVVLIINRALALLVSVKEHRRLILMLDLRFRGRMDNLPLIPYSAHNKIVMVLMSDSLGYILLVLPEYLNENRYFPNPLSIATSNYTRLGWKYS